MLLSITYYGNKIDMNVYTSSDGGSDRDTRRSTIIIATLGPYPPQGKI